MNKENLDNLRHSCAHLLAAAVLKLYPNAKPTVGPPIEEGFYYDFDFETPISENDLMKIDQKMRELVKKWVSVEKIEVSKNEALKKYKGNKYKQELINEFSEEGKQITFYKSGDFIDLCRGGHVENPSQEIKHFKLLSIAGAYWRGSEKNKMLTRIYGTAFKSKADLDNFLTMKEEAKKRDHKKLGKELDLFTFSDLVGSGLPLYTPKGALLRRLLTEYLEEIQSKEGYSQVWTPQLAKAELFKKSGHYDKFKDDMFIVKSHYSDEEMFLKPMNCPQHTQIYASKSRSYRDLPIRYTDFAMLYRDEQPGQLNGLARVRAFSQDDCHVFCREDQVNDEIDKMLMMTKKVMSTFGFKYRYRLSTRDPKHPEKYFGDLKTWDKVEKWAEKIMKRNNIDYFDGPGEATFYAPKMDLMATDALGREWQLSTVQIDFVQPARFELKFIDKDGKEKTPIMIHRAILGSSERLMMILIEHYSGAFPLWLAPVQVKIIPIAEKHNNFAQKIAKELKKNDIRTDVNEKSESMQKKIREAQLEKVYYMLVVGDREIDSGEINVRTRDGKTSSMTLDVFIKDTKENIAKRTNLS
ncbi:threonine--tRNA ligase [Candidatus Roizmanbacteria bacterium RIFCSPLOWO2_01_FULL_38_12]|uniref:Threonine--tRNA ligase n=1 Tax=Candidatus Roizmanbacteria bacterium RIFCSPLOWO2_01_FULL_38_12 TaxID=1802061 RepID=A0A1F7IV05_9BACT|nr:MAG: threonine--tRNA ligase [Candidatus Roizmanbacteria bacterium RIFCSPHIGHO2_01_FULL_38_15]OGK35047.1 MAG: threonine--tRNA ligase [Candidatus Roizmanbacteria bacterium RIFCSPHIGHO2_12_FULL_38_13]OGK47202.1 MAG: threonine--tRNA ligase [Candidatus Roizmanbacteria bacterium RIFCSPLOWO2_01_FULL_38_12]